MSEAQKGRFKLFDRVRVRFGVDRGHYGTVASVGGDDGTYYGIKLDCHDKEVGYSDHELDDTKVPPRPLYFGNGCYVPFERRRCPKPSHETEKGGAK